MVLVAGAAGGAQDQAGAALGSIDARTEHYADVARQIWELAEVGYQEERSSKLLQGELASAGFAVEAGVAGMPTGFVATYGSGEPVIGILVLVITSGGSAPNVVPDFAEVYYYVRHPEPDAVAELFERVVKTAEGAALGTGTTVDHEVIHGIYALLPNAALAGVMDRNLRQTGGVTYTAEERRFAEIIRGTLPDDAWPIESASEIAPFAIKEAGGSTDVGDVSWVVPTTGLRTATWVPGTSSHSWQAVAAGGTSIGTKGMMVAARTLAKTAIDLFTDPQLLAAATAEYREQVGPNFVYEPLLGDRPPPLDYRKR
jgi:aminobenzoyl-glutamate utilization protein B